MGGSLQHIHGILQDLLMLRAVGRSDLAQRRGSGLANRQGLALSFQGQAQGIDDSLGGGLNLSQLPDGLQAPAFIRVVF